MACIRDESALHFLAGPASNTFTAINADQSPIGMGVFTPAAAAIPKFGDPSAFQVNFCILDVLAPLVVLGTLRAWYTNQFSVRSTPLPSV